MRLEQCAFACNLCAASLASSCSCRGLQTLSDALRKSGKAAPAPLEALSLTDVVALANHEAASREPTPSDLSCDSHASLMMDTQWSLSGER
jgi:hypothetical protein